MRHPFHSASRWRGATRISRVRIARARPEPPAGFTPEAALTPSQDRPHTTRTLLILGVAALAFALGQTTLIPAFPELARALDTDASGVAWTMTGYLLAAAVCTPLVGRLGDMFGKRKLLVIALLAFAAGSTVSANRV